MTGRISGRLSDDPAATRDVRPSGRFAVPIPVAAIACRRAAPRRQPVVCGLDAHRLFGDPLPGCLAYLPPPHGACAPTTRGRSRGVLNPPDPDPPDSGLRSSRRGQRATGAADWMGVAAALDSSCGRAPAGSAAISSSVCGATDLCGASLPSGPARAAMGRRSLRDRHCRPQPRAAAPDPPPSGDLRERSERRCPARRDPRLFRRGDVFCLASSVERLPVVLIGAMAPGLPVVTARIMGSPELVFDRETGVLCDSRTRPRAPSLRVVDVALGAAA